MLHLKFNILRFQWTQRNTTESLTTIARSDQDFPAKAECRKNSALFRLLFNILRGLGGKYFKIRLILLSLN